MKYTRGANTSDYQVLYFKVIAIVEERNSRAGSGGLSPERGGILGSVIWTLVLSTPLRNIYCYMVPEVDC